MMTKLLLSKFSKLVNFNMKIFLELLNNNKILKLRSKVDMDLKEVKKDHL